MAKTVILIPTYNERRNIEILVPEIFAREPDVSVLVIDDNSPDGTGAAVQTLAERYPRLSLLARPAKQGLGEAYKAGMRRVLQDPDLGAVITMDADGSHAAEYLRALRARGATHGLVIGSRYTDGGGIDQWEDWRYFLSRWGNFYARTITGLPIRDMTAGFIYMDAAALRAVDFARLRASGYAFLMELKYLLTKQVHGSVAEVPIIFKARREGESKISHHIIAEGLLTPWRIRLN